MKQLACLMSARPVELLFMSPGAHGSSVTIKELTLPLPCLNINRGASSAGDLLSAVEPCFSSKEMLGQDENRQ